jgi:hypothetical protein
VFLSAGNFISACPDPTKFVRYNVKDPPHNHIDNLQQILVPKFIHVYDLLTCVSVHNVTYSDTCRFVFIYKRVFRMWRVDFTAFLFVRL